MAIRIETPLTHQKLKELKAGDSILISGEIYASQTQPISE